ncbi:MAG: arsenite methyltransferase [Candidatus Bathyarchaeia archaeon]
MKEEEIRKIVRESYAKAAKKESCCCSCECNKKIGYSKEEIESIPESAAFSLGCGNPVAFASVKEGETVLDLGCGGGLDCFLAAKKVGEKGHVIGVDMTPEMIDKARENCRKGKYKNVEFRLGEIENLPVADSSVDIVISNCVINLSPNKKRVFEEAFRVLKPGGRLMISDIVLLKELPKAIKTSKKAYVSCVSGAMMKEEYLELIKNAGFSDVKLVEENRFPMDFLFNDSCAEDIVKDLNISMEEAKKFTSSIASITVYGVKPK